MKQSKKIVLVLLGSIALTAVSACKEEPKTKQQQSAEVTQPRRDNFENNQSSSLGWFWGFLLGRSSMPFTAPYTDDTRSRIATPVIGTQGSVGAAPAAPPAPNAAVPNTVTRGGLGSTANSMSAGS